jgi:hypothetical protein
LAEGFVKEDAGGGGEVEAALILLHGDLELAIRVRIEEGFWEAGGFAAEEYPIGWGKSGVPVRRCGAGAGEEKVVGADGGEERFEIVVNCDLGFFDVVHAGAFEVSVGEKEAERTDKVELGRGDGAEARDVAGVLGNLWINESEF